MTSELSKTLYNSNITLEEKHRALLARLPAASSMTPRTTPSSSPAPTPEHRPTPLPHMRASHARRISVSPSDLALLADQNVELLQKLEKLETESTQANLAGRRRLGKLEKEIDVLRDELDHYKSQSESNVERVEEEAKKRRQEWNERVRAHRSNKSGSSWTGYTDVDSCVRDFAPSSSANCNRPTLPSAAFRPTLPTAPDTAPLSPRINSEFAFPAEVPDALPPTPEESLAASDFPPPVGESALVAQLVSKVRELEATNEEILESQRVTATRLHEAQLEAEEIRRLYAYLDVQAGVELDVVEDGEHGDLPVHDSMSTMRFQSLRRTINVDIRQSTPAFRNDAEAAREGTVHSNSLVMGHPLKARKTVVGLFDTPSQPARDGAEPAPMVTSHPSTPSLCSLDLPAGSLFSISRQASHVPTLGSELGSDYGSDYAENHHLRSSSLYDVFLSPGPSGTSRPATPPRDTQISSDPLQDEPQIPKQPLDLDKTPQSASFRGIHQQRLSDTIRARTHYWVDKRFHNTAPTRRLNSHYGPEARDGLFKNPVSAHKPTTVAQAAVQTMPSVAEEQNVALVKVDDPRVLQNTEVPKPKSRAMKVVVEIWLWVQFIAIIMVFLWAATKRGPRSVLRNTPQAVKRIE